MAVETHKRIEPDAEHICERLERVDPQHVVPEGELELRALGYHIHARVLTGRRLRRPDAGTACSSKPNTGGGRGGCNRRTRRGTRRRHGAWRPGAARATSSTGRCGARASSRGASRWRGYGSQIGYGTQIGCRDSGDLLVQIEDDVTIGERINLKVAALLALGPRSRIKADATCSGQLTLAAEASIKKHAHFEGGVVHEAERVPEHAVIRARWCPIHLDDGASRAAGGIHPTATIAEGVTLGR